MKHILRSLVFVLFAAGVCSAQSVLYFPQFVDGSQPGGYWGTIIIVTNPAALGTPAASGTLTVTKDNGTPLTVTFTDESGQPTPNTFQLAGGQTKFFLSPKVTATTVVPYNVGFATVTSSLPITGTSIFLEGNGDGPYALAGVPAATPLTRQTIIALKVDPSNTGLAVANPGSAAATITFQLLDKFGAPLAPQVTRTVAANNHTAFFISDLFPSVPIIIGTMRITSDQPIVSTALGFQNTAAFGTLPVFPLP